MKTVATKKNNGLKLIIAVLFNLAFVSQLNAMKSTKESNYAYPLTLIKFGKIQDLENLLDSKTSLIDINHRCQNVVINNETKETTTITFLDYALLLKQIPIAKELVRRGAKFSMNANKNASTEKSPTYDKLLSAKQRKEEATTSMNSAFLTYKTAYSQNKKALNAYNSISKTDWLGYSINEMEVEELNKELDKTKQNLWKAGVDYNRKKQIAQIEDEYYKQANADYDQEKQMAQTKLHEYYTNLLNS